MLNPNALPGGSAFAGALKPGSWSKYGSAGSVWNAYPKTRTLGTSAPVGSKWALVRILLFDTNGTTSLPLIVCARAQYVRQHAKAIAKATMPAGTGDFEG